MLRLAFLSITVFCSFFTLPALAAKHLYHNYQLDFIGEAQIPSGYEFEGSVVGGLSGIDYDAHRNTYYAISDDRVEPRFYELSIALEDGSLEDGDIQFKAVHTIEDKNGAVFDTQPDPESIRVLPFLDLLFWSSERLGTDNTPFVRVMTRSGSHVAEFDLPTKFIASDDSGTRSNVGFESLSFKSNDKALYVANESALVQDGEKATLEHGSPVRVLKLNANNGQAQQEYIYMVDPIAKAPVPLGGFADSGLVELLVLDKHYMLAMERSFSLGAGYSVKLYLTSTRGATNVRRFDSIKDRYIRPMRKQLLLDLDELGLSLDNIEGITFGPELDGTRSLVLVSDDNFSAFGPQVSQFLAFKLHDFSAY